MNKYYKRGVKIFSVIAFILFIFALTGFLNTLAFDSVNDYDYSSFYSWRITDSSAKKTEDGRYFVTLDLKNNSVYSAQLYNYSIRAYAGKSEVTVQRPVEYSDSRLFSSLNDIIIPAGAAVQYSFYTVVPEGCGTLEIEYSGDSYELHKQKGSSDDYYMTYTVNLPR